MKPSPRVVRAALSELFKGIKLDKAVKPAADRLSRFTASFNEPAMPPPPLTPEESKIARQLSLYLKNELEKSSSKSPVTDHFLDLFTGLNIISASEASQKASSVIGLPEKQKIVVLSQTTDAAQLLGALNELYYRSRLSHAVASAILKNQAFKDVDHMHRLIFGRGNVLNWTRASYYIFKLQLANKYWVMGEKDKAKQQIVDGFESEWAPVVETGELSRGVLMGLAKALLLFQRPDLIETLVHKWTTSTTKATTAFMAQQLMPFTLECYNQQSAYPDLFQRVLAMSRALAHSAASQPGDASFYELVFTCLGELPANTNKSGVDLAPLLSLLAGPKSSAHGALSASSRAAVLVQLTDLACKTGSETMYTALEPYVDRLISPPPPPPSPPPQAARTPRHNLDQTEEERDMARMRAETLSIALALQKLHNFRTTVLPARRRAAASAGDGGSGSSSGGGGQQSAGASEDRVKSVLT